MNRAIISLNFNVLTAWCLDNRQCLKCLDNREGVVSTPLAWGVGTKQFGMGSVSSQIMHAEQVLKLQFQVNIICSQTCMLNRFLNHNFK